MSLYPGAQVSETRAVNYGPLPTHGQTEVAVVFHTTETRGMPSFREGATAPHYTYRASDRTFREWLDPRDGYVGTLTGHSTPGHRNCKAIQLEIIAASSKASSDKNGAVWVGDLTDENYLDLASFYEWCIDKYQVVEAVYAEPDGGWVYGKDSPHRLSEADWEVFGGLTAHGGVYNTSHWDTGILDLRRVYDIATSDTPTPPPPEPPPPGDDMWNILRRGDGFWDGPNPSYRSEVVAMQAMLREHGFVDDNTQDDVCGTDGAFGPGTERAVVAFQRSRSITADGICGPDTWAALRQPKR